MLEQYPEVLTVDDLSKIFPISRSSLYRMISNNQLKHLKVGSRILVPKNCVIELLNQAL